MPIHVREEIHKHTLSPKNGTIEPTSSSKQSRDKDRFGKKDVMHTITLSSIDFIFGWKSFHILHFLSLQTKSKSISVRFGRGFELSFLLFCLCVYVCVWERERERERDLVSNCEQPTRIRTYDIIVSLTMSYLGCIWGSISHWPSLETTRYNEMVTPKEEENMCTAYRTDNLFVIIVRCRLWFPVAKTKMMNTWRPRCDIFADCGES